jgi:hypothetical protein
MNIPDIPPVVQLCQGAAPALELPVPSHERGAEPCHRCGTIDRPTLSPGTGPHACKASCAHCGRFIRWVSLLAPAERHARRVRARMQAMAQRPPSPDQLSYLHALGDADPPPQTMLEASTRLDALLKQKEV